MARPTSEEAKVPCNLSVGISVRQGADELVKAGLADSRSDILEKAVRDYSMWLKDPAIIEELIKKKEADHGFEMALIRAKFDKAKQERTDRLERGETIVINLIEEAKRAYKASKADDPPASFVRNMKPRLKSLLAEGDVKFALYGKIEELNPDSMLNYLYDRAKDEVKSEEEEAC